MEFTLNQEEQQFLIDTAREAIAARLEKRDALYPHHELDPDSVIFKPCGAFVSLHIKKQLRSCIGSMMAVNPLYETVQTMAVEAAFGDPRFPPLSKDEFKIVSIEISALSLMEICNDPQSVKVGVHGLYLSHKGRSGVLLPQVPVEQGWNLEQYLEYICIKAGLPPGSYSAPGAKLSTFTAFVFGQ
jgi:AmmeMemoRadiSam system protein A